MSRGKIEEKDRSNRLPSVSHRIFKESKASKILLATVPMEFMEQIPIRGFNLRRMRSNFEAF